MASLVQHNFMRGLYAGEFDLDTDDIRAALLMTNTTADTEATETLMNGFTTLDECDATGYARIDMAGLTITQDDANTRAEFDATDLSFTGLGGDATRSYQGVLIYKHVTNDTDSIPLFFVEFSNQPITSAATQVDVPWDAQGILQLSQGA